jgi:3' exoribonuclease, RNase T-like
MSNHFIIDAETFGQNVNSCAIINFSYTIFDYERFIDNPYSYDELLASVQVSKLNVAKQVEDGYIIEPSSLDFWAKVSSDAKKQLKPDPINDLTYDQFCNIMLSYIGKDKIDYWWSRSNTFDPALLWRVFNDSSKLDQLNFKLKFWKVRDTRTFIDAKTDFKLNMNGFIPIDKEEWDLKFREHDSKHDIVGDVLRMQRLVRAENGL